MRRVDASNPRQWADVGPYLLQHLPAYAASAGRLAELAQDTGFLIHADPGSLLEVLDTVTTTAPAEARLYGMAADHLQNAAAAQRAAILRTTAAEENASLLSRFPPTPPLSARWADTRPQPFHRKVFSHAGGVYATAFGALSDGTPLVATGGGDGAIRLWDPATMTLRATLPGHASPVVALAFGTLPDADGTTLLAVGDDSSVVRLWNVGNITVHAELPAPGGVNRLCFGSLPDGTLLLATAARGTKKNELYEHGLVSFWDPATGGLRRLFTVVPGLVGGLAFETTSDGSPLLAVGSNDGIGNGGVCVWNLATGEQVGEFGRHAIFALTFCTLPNGSTLLVTVDSWDDDESGDGNVALWDTRTWKCLVRYNKKAGYMSAVASGRLSGNSVCLALGTRSGRTLLIDPATSELRAVLSGHDGTVRAVTFGALSDGSPLVVTGAAAGDTTARVWDPTVKTKVSLDVRPQPELHEVCSGVLADGTTLLATGEGAFSGGEGYVRLRDPVRGQVRGTIPCQARCVLAIDFTRLADGACLIGAGGDDGKVTLLDAATGNKRATFTAHHGPVTAIAFGQLEDGTPILATGSRGGHGQFFIEDRYVRLWNAATTKLHATLTGRTGGGVDAIAFWRTPDNRFILATGGCDTEKDKYFEYRRSPELIGGDIRLWNLADMTLLGALPRQPGGITALAFASFPDGSTVLATAGGYPDYAVKLWDPFTQELHTSFSGHTQRVLAAAFGVLADGTIVLATGGYDSTIRLWDPETSRLLGSVPTSTPIRSVAFSQDGLAVGTRRGIIMFDLPSPWRAVGWPAPARSGKGTPQYILDPHPSTLIQEPQRLAQLAGDVGWIEAVIRSAGADHLVADLRRAVAANPANRRAAAVLAAVAGQAHHLRPPQPLDQPGYILRQLWMQAAELAEDDLAEDIRSRLQSRPSTGPVPRWTTRRAGRAPYGESGRHDHSVGAVEVLPDGQVVTGGDDGRVLVWDPADPGAGPAELGRHGSYVGAMTVLPDGRVVTGADDGRVLVWDLADPGAGPAKLGRHYAAVRAAAVLADGRVVTGGDDWMVKAWDPADPGADPAGMEHHNPAVLPAVLPDGRVVTAADDGRVLVWDLADPDAGPAELGRHGSYVGAMTVLPDGRVVTGADNGRVLVWDLADPGAGPTELGRHYGPVHTAAVLADGRLVTAGDDGRVLIWDLASAGTPVVELTCSVTALATAQRGPAKSDLLIAHKGSGFSLWSFTG